MAADPGLTDGSAYLQASEYVSPPDIALHVSGAAVDLTLVGPSGRPLDMGTAIDATPEDSDRACFFAAANISEQARANRAVLATALTSAGLVNYPTEWWHWSYGDRYWALMTGRPHALFGPVRTPAGRAQAGPTAGPRVALVHYADLLADLAGEMRRLATLLGISVPEDQWSSLIEAATFTSMRSHADLIAPNTAGVLKDGAAFFRSGSSGAGRVVLTDLERAAYERRVAAALPEDAMSWLHR